MKTKLLLLFLVATLNSFAQDRYETINIALQLVKSKTKIDGKDKRLLNLLENMYNETLQANEGQLSEATINMYKTFAEDPNLPNSHLFYLFNLYQEEIQNPEVTSDFQIGCMKLLSGEFVETYNTIPAIVLIYMGEALMAANMQDKAKTHFEMASGFYPDSVPIKVYNYILTDEGPAKENVRKSLLKKYPDHWMVKQMVK